jgi:ankyrin repeat protein
MSVLHFAVLGGNDSIVKKILSDKNFKMLESIDNHNRTALHLATSNIIENDKIIEILLTSMSPEFIRDIIILDDSSYSQLITDAVTKQIDSLDILIKSNSSKHDYHFKKGNFLFALGHEKQALEEYNHCDTDEILLHYITLEHSTKIVRWMIDSKPEILYMIDQNGQTALHRAVDRGNKKAIEILLDKMSLKTINIKDKSGNTALEVAIKKNRGDELSRIFELKIVEKQELSLEVSSDLGSSQKIPLHLIEEDSSSVFGELGGQFHLLHSVEECKGQYEAKTMGESSEF